MTFRPLGLALPLLMLVGCGPSRLSDADITRLCMLEARCGSTIPQSTCESVLRMDRDQASARSCSSAFGATGRCQLRVNSCTATDECTDEIRRLDECFRGSVTPDSGIRVPDARLSGTDARVTGTDARIPMTGTEGAIRQTNGYLEIFHDGEWRGVCDDSFSEGSAEVVCRQLGTPSATATVQTAVTGASAEFWLDGVSCLGSEPQLSLCEHVEWGVEDCGTGEHLLVSCEGF